VIDAPRADRATRYWPVALAYLILGLVAYGRILDTFFVADDFSYLDELSRAESPAVIFSALAGRYFRPAVVLVYYLNYQLSGLSPWTYHLSVVLVHVVNAWLIFLLGRAIAPGRGPMVPALAGGLFLVFGGHAEAVTWIGGMADPLLTFFLLLALLFFLWSLESVKPLPLLIGAWLAFAAALLSKESAAAFLGFAVVGAALASPVRPDWQRVRRTLLALTVLVVVLAAYFALRKMVLGFTFVNLDGLGTNTNVPATARAFVLRSFLPQGSLLGLIWTRFLDVFLIAPVVLGLIWYARRTDYRPLLVLLVFFGLAIAPVLPLSISILTSESERLIYLPSAFACLLTAWLVDSAVKRRWLVVTVMIVFSLWHLRALDRTNRTWVTAAALTRSQTTSFGEVMRNHGRSGQTVFVVNVTDNVRGAFIWRRGFHEALRLTSPDQAAAMAQMQMLSVTQVWDENAPVTVSEKGPNRFELRLASGSVAGGPSSTPLYSLADWSPIGFTAEFTPAAGRGLVVYFTPAQARVAGTLEMSAVPFGYIDLPKDAADCSGDAADLQGWALDGEGIDRVSVALEIPGSSGAVEIGNAQRLPRPDVAAAYPGYPDSLNAGWTFSLPCKRGPGAAVPNGSRIHVSATNRRGATATLGVKTVVVR